MNSLKDFLDKLYIYIFNIKWRMIKEIKTVNYVL